MSKASTRGKARESNNETNQVCCGQVLGFSHGSSNCCAGTNVLSRVSDSPPSPLLPQAPSRSHVPPPPPHPLNCDQKCSTLCAEKRIFRRMICYGVCMAKCTIFPLEHANFPCTQNCVVNPLHSNPSMNECSS